MTTRYYSPGTRGFYSSDVHPTPSHRPVDCVEVSDELFRTLLTKQEQGEEIVWDASVRKGSRLTTRPPVVTMENIRRLRDSKLRASDWSQSLDVPEAVRTKWTAYRQELRDIPQTFADRPKDVVFPTPPSA